MAAAAFDAFGLLFDAVRKARRADSESIRQGLARTEDYQGVTGTITFRDRGGDPPKPVVIVQIRQGTSALFKEVNP